MAERKNNIAGEQCPYWSKQNSHECKMTKGGLYIPMPEHVDMFCSKPQYSQCHQYLRGRELLQETARKYGFIVEGGRRKYRRVSDRTSLSLTSCDESLNLQELIDGKAFTVDLSLGGMRLESNAEIQKDSLVSFQFSSEFSVPNLSGVGEVKWCEPLENSDLYQAGIAFADFKLTQAIGSHLGLPMM
jgi:hypothetical protein